MAVKVRLHFLGPILYLLMSTPWLPITHIIARKTVKELNIRRVKANNNEYITKYTFPHYAHMM